jgi:hypothetical protein
MSDAPRLIGMPLPMAASSYVDQCGINYYSLVTKDKKVIANYTYSEGGSLDRYCMYLKWDTKAAYLISTYEGKDRWQDVSNVDELFDNNDKWNIGSIT